MKTKTNNGNVKAAFTNTNSSVLKMAGIILLLVFSTGKLISQNQNAPKKGSLGVAVSGNISVNGYGTEYLPGIFYKKGRMAYYVSANVQKQRANLSGVQLSYQYYLTGPGTPCEKDCDLELFAFVSAAYHYNALMGKNTCRNEQLADPSYAENKVYDYRFNSAEIFGGIGLNIPFLNRFKWSNSIGLGAVTTFNMPSHLYYNGQATGLMLRTGIIMSINNIK